MPYIPEEQKKYHLLPKYHEMNLEYIIEPLELTKKIEDASGLDALSGGIKSLDDYLNRLEQLEREFQNNDDVLSIISEVRDYVIRKNQKEKWSVVKYIGKEFRNHFTGLTTGKYYYWPCDSVDPEYMGTIGDDEMLDCFIPTSDDWWEIAYDPTGMAKEALSGGKGAVSLSEYEEYEVFITSLIERGKKLMSEYENTALKDRNYYMVRAMLSRKEDFDVFFDNSVVAVGWSDVPFDRYDADQINVLLEDVKKIYYDDSGLAPQMVGRNLNQVRRFMEIKEGDIIVVPYYSYIRVAVAKSRQIYAPQYGELDLANQLEVEYLKYEEEYLTIPRDELSEALQRRLRVRGSTISDLYEFGEQIEGKRLI